MRTLLLMLVFSLFAQAASDETSATTNSIDISSGKNRETKQLQVLQQLIVEREIDSTYLVGVGDMFEFLVEDHNFVAQVSPEGFISLEEIGLVHVGGLPLFQAKKALASALAKKYGSQFVHIQIATLKSFPVRIYGAIQVPGVLNVAYGTRLSTVLKSQGGVVGVGNEEAIHIFRGSDTLVFNYTRSEMEGDESQNPMLIQGDVIFVPFIPVSAPKIEIQVGEERKSSLWSETRTLEDYLKSTGFIRSMADIRGFRFHGEGLDSIAVAAPEAAYQYRLPKGTRVEAILASSWVYVGGSGNTAGRVGYDPRLKPYDYVAATGLNNISGDLESMEVHRANGKVENVDPWSGTIYPGDVIYLPKRRFETVKDVTVFVATVVGIIVQPFTLYILWRSN